MQLKIYGNDAKQINEGDIFKAEITSVEGRTVAVLRKQEPNSLEEKSS